MLSTTTIVGEKSKGVFIPFDKSERNRNEMRKNDEQQKKRAEAEEKENDDRKSGYKIQTR